MNNMSLDLVEKGLSIPFQGLKFVDYSFISCIMPHGLLDVHPNQRERNPQQQA